MKNKIKIALNESEAYSIEEKYENKPHGWIQWKGTDVCMDIYCKCNTHLHADCSFLYNVKCLNCNTIYRVNGHIELIELHYTPNIIVELSGD